MREVHDMEPFYQWRDGIIYAVFIYGAHYTVVLSYYQHFEDVVQAVRDHCIDKYSVKEPLPLIVLSSTYLGDAQAKMLEDEELISLRVG